MDYTPFIVLAVFIVLIITMILYRSLITVGPFQQGVVTIFGSFRRVIPPGLSFVHPLSLVTKVDLRTQVLDVRSQDATTKDNSPTNLQASVSIKVVDPKAAVFQVKDFREATVALAQTTLRSIVGELNLDEVLYHRERINSRLRDALGGAVEPWGIRVEAVEIKDVEAVGSARSSKGRGVPLAEMGATP